MKDHLPPVEPDPQPIAGKRPGELIGTGWVPWRVEDLNPKDTVQFVPQDVVSLHFPVRSVNDKPLIKVDVNDLGALYEVGTLTATNKFFYNSYVTALDNQIKLDKFKNEGNTKLNLWDHWVYVPEALSFGIDLEGRPLLEKDWYEFKDGIPVMVNNMALLVKLYFGGHISFNLTKGDVLKLMAHVLKGRVKNSINKIWRKK